MKLLIFTLAFSISAFAQVSDNTIPLDSRTLRQEGQLFTIQMVLGEPIRFFVVGKEEAKVDLSELKMTVRRLKPYPGKVLSLDLENGYFVSTKLEDLRGATELEVTTLSKAKSDKVKFKMENQKP